MTGVSIDTNVLLRYLVRDDAEQYGAAAALVARASGAGVPVLILFGVLIEAEWVLRSRYKLDKPSILEAFKQLLESDDVQHEDEDALEEALFQWRQSKADFTDCMLAAKAGRLGRRPFLTFDADAAQLPGAQLLIP